MTVLGFFVHNIPPPFSLSSFCPLFSQAVKIPRLWPVPPFTPFLLFPSRFRFGLPYFCSPVWYSFHVSVCLLQLIDADRLVFLSSRHSALSQARNTLRLWMSVCASREVWLNKARALQSAGPQKASFPRITPQTPHHTHTHTPQPQPIAEPTVPQRGRRGQKEGRHKRPLTF